MKFSRERIYIDIVSAPARRIGCIFGLFLLGMAGGQAKAASISPQLNLFTLTNASADGSVIVSPDGLSFVLTGGNTGSGVPGTTTFSGLAPIGGGTLNFDYLYETADLPTYDNAGYFINGTTHVLTDTAPGMGSITITLTGGVSYGFFVNTADNSGEPGVLSIAFSSAATNTPEPSSITLSGLGMLLLIGLRRKMSAVRGLRVDLRVVRLSGGLGILAVTAGTSLFAQTQSHYLASSVTGQLSLARTVNVSALSLQPQALRARPLESLTAAFPAAQDEISNLPSQFPHPPLMGAARSRLTPFSRLQGGLAPEFSARFSKLVLSDPLLSVGSGPAPFGFDALNHSDQRLAAKGNQLSVEPPNPSLAVANGFVLEGVNNAIRVFDSQTGLPVTRTLSSNELFGVAPAIDRATGARGVFPTDMRVFYDSDIDRWFVLQRSQDNDIFGNPVNQSHLYLAVSQTPDPTGTYNIYVMDTTNALHQGCPCVADYPQVGADQYGFYISANEYNTSALEFVDATITAVSKLALSTGAVSPAAYRFIIPRVSGYEFAIQPASVPKLASQFIASGGVEYFVSSQSALAVDSHLAIWALSNTASLQTGSASLLLTQTTVPTLTYSYPDLAVQKPGSLPYGSSLFPPAPLAFIDGGSDSRILSVSYAGGRLFATLATQVTDDAGRSLVGGAYVIISPTFRAGVLSGVPLKQGFLIASGQHILRPAIAVNAQGRGAIAFTITGPNTFPSAAFVSVDTVTSPSTLQISGVGMLPEDGFTGYPGGPFPGVARWGDYSTAVVGTDGNVWMVSEYIPDDPRTQLANWGTYITRFVP